MKTKKSSYNKLTKKEVEVLEQLKRREDITITSADKSDKRQLSKTLKKLKNNYILPKIIDHYPMTQQK